jgi:hypothetical protein
MVLEEMKRALTRYQQGGNRARKGNCKPGIAGGPRAEENAYQLFGFTLVSVGDGSYENVDIGHIHSG